MVISDELNVLDITNSISKMNSKASMGHDGIPGSFVFNYELSLAIPLSKLFNLILKESISPNKWKSSHIIPIYKDKGDRSDIINYTD